MNPEELIFRGTTHVVVEEDLKKKLASGKKLRIKLGIDPSGARLTIGHAVNLWRLKAFQDLGHQIVLIIGTFTGQIGDFGPLPKSSLPTWMPGQSARQCSPS